MYFLPAILIIFFSSVGNANDCSNEFGNSDPPSNPKPVVVAIIKRGSHYLFIRRNPAKEDGGLWAPVTGKVEQGETIEMALVREIREEVGLEVENFRSLMNHVALSQKHHLYWFQVEIPSGQEPRILTPDEISELAWLTFQEIEQKQSNGQTHPEVANLMREAESFGSIQ